ncbi:MAG: DUF421 domain-containing protein [Bacilli bacterium]
MEIFNVVYKTIFFYILILILFRLMGKREIAQLSIQDLVVSILIAEIVAISIENPEKNIMITVLPIVLLVGLEMIMAFISLKSNKFRNILEGKPVLLINNGLICFKELVKQRYSLDNLLASLRSNNIKDIEEVEYAVLENNGKLSVFKYNFLKMKSPNPFPIILDGKIQNDTLKYLHKNISWINNILLENKANLKDIFYAFYKNNKVYIIYKKN